MAGVRWETAFIDAGVWSGWSVLSAWIGSLWSMPRLGHDGWLTRLRPWETDGRLYRRLGIRRWKPLIPDLRGIFGGAARHGPRRHEARRYGAPRRRRAEWEALAAETRRAERVHWLIMAAVPVLLVYNRGVLAAAMIGYAVVANGPCILIQRYNRLRLLRLIGRH